ncbi:MAG: patatin-like phospholipase family protein [Steroidobacteraceae bacterium]
MNGTVVLSGGSAAHAEAGNVTQLNEYTGQVSKTALVLPGGGARAAYQIGVLKALSDLLPVRANNPFSIVIGTSAGAINATELAIHAHRFRVAVGNLERVWRNFQVPQVFEIDALSMFKSGLHWLLAMLSGGWLLPPPRAMFDNSPLRALLSANFDFARIEQSIHAGNLDALAISAAGYGSSRSVFFFQAAAHQQPWTRVRHAGEPAEITLDHLMASVAVPFLFPAVQMGSEFYGDGSMRQSSPFSPAIHLGADRIMVVATRSGDRQRTQVPTRGPGFGQIFGYMLDALFSDGLYADFERLMQINNIIRKVGPVTVNERLMKPIEMLVVMPSRDIAEIARQHVHSLPRTLRVLLRTMGALNASGSELMSYLMFQSSFTRDLIDLGYQDGMAQSSKLVDFLQGSMVDTTGMTAVLRRLDLQRTASTSAPEGASAQEQRSQTQ